MREQNWNAHQRAAIDMRGKSVVVSAAAGSGKTSVLAERVLALVREGASIERMLIVTFTNLAAGEMRERIYRALLDAGRTQQSARLAAQADICAAADISTIHAFCNRVVRDNFAFAGVSPVFSVGSSAETGALMAASMDAVMAQMTAQPDAEAFLQRYAPRGDTRGIERLVTAVYRRAISMKDPAAWLGAAADNFESDDFAAVLFDAYRQMTGRAAAQAGGYIAQRTALWESAGFGALAEKSRREAAALETAMQSMTMTHAALPEMSAIRADGVKGAPNRASLTLGNKANRCLEPLSEYAVDFGKKVRAELAGEAADGKRIAELTRALMDEYARRKRAHNILDHDDALHFARKALEEPCIAQRYRDRYDHIFVDEYQDINDVQHAIIERLGRGGNDFLVGDVKQCIYTFRESDPGLLIGRCEALRGDGLIEMNTNYRSAPEVIDFINGVMHHMMDEQAGGVKYAGGQRLAAGRDGGGGGAQILMAAGGSDKTEAEAALIAQTIGELKAQGFAYRDIAVLRPEVRSSGQAIADALTEAGIPVACGFDGSEQRFGEVSVFVNLLALVDGSADDVALVSVMRYPHFGFSEPEMARIRIWADGQAADEPVTYLDAVRAYHEDGELYEKTARFWRTIGQYRTMADSLTMPDFLMQLRQAAAFETIALTSPGGQRSDDAVLGFIREAAAMDLAGLPDVLDAAPRILEADNAEAPGAADAVYLTTIHKSKGLEFGAVILSGMHLRINMTDTSGAVLVGRELGIALDIVDGQTRIKTPTMHKKAVAQQLRTEKLSETVRLLYVGMTRAARRLVITGAGEAIKEDWTAPMADGWQMDATTYFDLVMPAAAMACADSGTSIETVIRVMEAETTASAGADKRARLEAFFEEAAKHEPAQLFEAYAFADRLGVPSKVSVSMLKKAAEPEWMAPTPVEAFGDGGAAAAQRGTAAHRALQMLGLEERDPEAVRRRMDELAAQGILSGEISAQIDEAQLARFLHCDAARRARAAQRCWTEAPFCLVMGADEAGLGRTDEPVIVQGVIDLCFIEDGEWVIVDYKTDSVDKKDVQAAAEKHAAQLGLYAKALALITKIPVKQTLVYFLKPGEAVEIG